MNTVLNVGLDPGTLDVPHAPGAAFPGVGAAQVRAGLESTAAALTEMGLVFESYLIDRTPGAEAKLHAFLARKKYAVIVFGGGVRLDPAMTPLFEKLVNVARVHAPESVLCFNTGPDTTVDAVRRWWPESPERAEVDLSARPSQE